MVFKKKKKRKKFCLARSLSLHECQAYALMLLSLQLASVYAVDGTRGCQRQNATGLFVQDPFSRLLMFCLSF